MTLKEYIAELNSQYQTGIAREHTYRPALQQLLSRMLPHLIVSNDPARLQCGAPDFLLMRKTGNIPVAFVEAKDIGDSDLAGKKQNKEQFDRYKRSLDNIVFTDYLEFWFFEKGEYVERIPIAEVKGGKIVAQNEHFEKFESLINHFGNSRPQRISSSLKLAQMMAAKARLMADVIEKILNESGDDNILARLMEAFKEVLIHDITPKGFADVYAQTIAYGLFAARLHDTTPESYSRRKAAELIPMTNPFLRQLFQSIAVFDLDKRFCWIVDDLSEMFCVTDIESVMQGFGKRTQQTDPMIHFYESFLSAYDPALRKSRGVWYTPQAVVNFIVRAVDGILQSEFGLPMGLADTSKIEVERNLPQSPDGRYKENLKREKVSYHKVQILDPATGTGTFLAEVVSQIFAKFEDQPGKWQSYVAPHLLPRLNGFEILIASYTMAHLKLDRLLCETGYVSDTNERLRIFLTNSLEESCKESGTLFSQYLAREANGASTIKSSTPVMVVMGNPPYNGTSENKSDWIMGLMENYKMEPGTLSRLRERNAKWVNNDYCKFIRLGQYFVNKMPVREGILAYINSNSFLDSKTFRGMRWNLMDSFDQIYIINLHGNSNKGETAPDGSADENVFDIKEGVTINVFVKSIQKPKGTLAEVYYFDLYGRRQQKYDYLLKNELAGIPFVKLKPTAPQYLFTPMNCGLEEEYNKGVSVVDCFTVNSVGIVTARDGFTIHQTPEETNQVIDDFLLITDEQAREKYRLGLDVRDWSVAGAKKDLQTSKRNIVPIAYRPFDVRNTNFTGITKGFHCMPRTNVMQHFLRGNNIGLMVSRQQKTNGFYHCLVHKNIVESSFVSNKTSEIGYSFPLYLYPSDPQTSTDGIIRRPNLKQPIIEKFANLLGLSFEIEKSGDERKFAPIDLLDYIYAILHSPLYREKYKEFLKIDFPRVPYPKNADEFRQLASLGSELRLLHLLEHSTLLGMNTEHRFLGANSNAIHHVLRGVDTDIQNGEVWINETQYFENVPDSVWNFYIGGYQPARKWLKDRIGRTLTFDEIEHYQRIIVALKKTMEIMKKIEVFTDNK